MKKFIATFLITSGLAVSIVAAQTTTTPTHMPPSPATLAQMRVNRLTKLLTLTSSQQSQALTIFTTEYTNDAATQTSLKTERQALATAVKANDSTGIAAAATQIGTLTGTLVQTEATANAAFYQILNSTQQTQFGSVREFGFGGPMGGGPMRGFGRGGN